jgi:hypothetical protein
MTGSFDERRKAHEEKWAHDEDLKFKIHARRDKLLGEWAAEELGLKGPQMHVYAQSVVEADLSKAGDNDVLKKLRADFAAKNVAHSDRVIRRQMDALLKIAQEQVMNEKKK